MKKNLIRRFLKAISKDSKRSQYSRNPKRRSALEKLELIAKARELYQRNGSVLRTTRELRKEGYPIHRDIVTEWVADLTERRSETKKQLFNYALDLKKKGFEYRDVSEKIEENFSLPWSLRSKNAIANAISQKHRDEGIKGKAGRKIKIDTYGLGSKIKELRSKNLNNRQILIAINQEIQEAINRGELPNNAILDYRTLTRWLSRNQIDKPQRKQKQYHDQLTGYYQQGLTDAEIAQALNVNRDLVEDWRKDQGLPTNAKVRLEKLKKEALKLRKTMSVLAISKKLGVSRNTLTKWFETD